LVFGHVPNDAQAQPGPAGLLGTGFVHPVEALEDTRETLLGDADAAVRDHHDDLVLVGACADLYTPAGRGVLHSVLYEVREHGGELRLLTTHGVRGSLAGAFPGEGDVLLAGGRTQAGEHHHEDTPDVHRPRVLNLLLALQARQV